MERKSVAYRILAVLISVCLIMVSARAETFEQVRGLVNKGQIVIPSGVTVHALVISDYRSYNTELNPNISFNKVDLSLSHRTAYIESLDGRFGFRILFDSMYDNRLERGMDINLDLSGCTLMKDANTESYTIEGITAQRISVICDHKPLPVKKKRISQLTREDIYTYTTVEDLEFLVKQGAFSNIYEMCAQASDLNLLNPPFRAADGWASLLEDGSGRHIYMQLNSKCEWRRNDFHFPKGIGELSGVIVCNNNRRYGCNFGAYSIRPIFREDIGIGEQPESHFRTVVEWNWNFNTHQALKCKTAGEIRWVKRSGVKDDSILPDNGEGELWTDSGCAMSLDGEYDSRFCAIANGAARTTASALRIDGKTEKWYPSGGPAGVYVKTSMSGVKGKGVLFNFSFVAGNESYYKSWGCPAFWTVEYSIDGKIYKPTGFEARLRPIAFYQSQIAKKGYMGAPYDAAMGFSEYSVMLPSSLLGEENLYVRIVPKNTWVVVLQQDWTQPIDNVGRASQYNNDFCMRFGMLGIKVY